MIRVVLPYHLRNLARVGAEVEVDAGPDATAAAVLDALEADYPVLRGTIRDHGTKARRAYVRYFVCGRDASFEPADAVLPPEVQAGDEPFLVIGALSGG